MADYSFTTTLAPSGSFAAANHNQIMPLVVPEIETAISIQVTFNPGLLERFRDGYRQSPLGTTPANVIRSLQIADHVVTDSGMEDYARAMRDLVADFQASPCDCYLAPLRGARLPSLLVNIMTERQIVFEHFDYHHGCDRVRTGEPRLRREVTDILVRCDPQRSEYRLAVVDVVEGGYGMPALVDLLESIKNSVARLRSQQWTLDLRLLHAADLGTRLRDLLHRSTARFEVRTKFYRVADTIIEDFDDALGFALVAENDVSILKPCVRGGRFLYKSRNGVTVVESNDLNITIQDFVARKITDDLVSDPALRQIGDKWKDYSEKG